jgi:hypothetical protein
VRTALARRVIDHSSEIVPCAHARKQHVCMPVLVRVASRIKENAIERLPLRLIDGLHSAHSRHHTVRLSAASSD